MEKLLRLQKGIDQLSNIEFLEVIKTFGKNKFRVILFEYFHEKLKQIEKYQQINDILSPVDKINHIIADIITSRKDKLSIEMPQDEQQTEPVKLDELPSVMLSHISSFIDFTDLLHFEQCNRSIFIATRSASPVFELNDFYFNKIWKYSFTHKSVYFFYRFTSLTRLHVHITEDPTKYRTPSINNVLKTSQLKYLEMSSDDELIPLSILNNLSQCNLSNILHFTYDGDELPTNVLQKVHNVEYVSLRLGDEYEALNVNQLSPSFEQFTKLKGLQILIDKPFEHSIQNIGLIVDHVGSTLQSLHTEHDFIEQNKFDNLRELCLSSPTKSSIDISKGSNLAYVINTLRVFGVCILCCLLCL